MGLEDMTLAERSQFCQDMCCVMTLTRGPWSSQVLGTENRAELSRGWRRGNAVLVVNGDRISVWENEKVLAVDGGDG